MDNGREQEQAKTRYHAAVRSREFEIELFWKRSLFFWGFIGATFIGFVGARAAPKLAVVIASFGLVSSAVWTLANRGSKYWYESWETKVEAEEPQVTGPLFARQELPQQKSVWLGAQRYSVSRLLIALSDYVTVFWLAIVAYEVVVILRPTALPGLVCDLAAVSWALVSCIYVLVVCRVGRSR